MIVSIFNKYAVQEKWEFSVVCTEINSRLKPNSISLQNWYLRCSDLDGCVPNHCVKAGHLFHQYPKRYPMVAL